MFRSMRAVDGDSTSGERRGTFQASIRECRQSVGRDEDDIRLYDVRIAQDDVERRDVDLAEAVRCHMRIEHRCKA